MLSKRLLAVASFIKKKDKVIDIGCDHGYLGIYLVKNNLVNDILLTDINQNALDNALLNIKKSGLEINTKLTDGLKGINLDNYNTISISGMGTNTILKILEDLSNNYKIIIQSNNDLELLRTSLYNNNYYLQDEITTYDKGHFYLTGLYTSKKNNLTKQELKYGLIKKDKKDYYQNLITQKESILINMPENNQKRIKDEINIIKKLLEECR